MSKSVSNNVFKKKTGIQNIQAYLESGRSITALEALSNFGIFRLASAIEVLRKRGMSIETEMKEDPNGKTYARYTLVVPVEAEVAAEEQQPKFKVGDRIKVTNYPYPHDSVCGLEGTVTGVGDLWPVRAQLEGRDWSDLFHEAELTLLAPAEAPAEAPKKELKVGARVRVTALYPDSADHGRIGTMQRILEDVPFPFYVLLDGDAAADPYTAEELEVI